MSNWGCRPVRYRMNGVRIATHTKFDAIPEFEGLEGSCGAAIAACCFSRSFFLSACNFSVAALFCFPLLPPRGIANKTVGTSVHHGDMSRHGLYAVKRHHYVQTDATAAYAALQAAHLFVAASPNCIKTTDEVSVHAPASFGSYEQVHWVGNNPQWSEVLLQLTGLN